MAKKKRNNKGKKKAKQHGRGSKDAQRSTAVNEQIGSLLYQRLPQEIRDDIWCQLFSSTRFTFGDRPTGRIKPAPNGLAMLRTCRRAWHEIGDSWLRYVLFCFDDTNTMLDKLTRLPIDTLSKLRHMRIRGDTLMLNYPEDDVYYRLVSVFKLLPGLCLDQLTVLSGRGHQVSYDTLGGLIKDGNGWKTLRYICFSSAVLGYPSDWDDLPRYWRKPQPSDWQAVMEARDGVESNPSVTVYRAKTPGHYGSILDPSTRVKFEQKPHRDHNLERPQDFPADVELMNGDEKNKELMVVVKRGSGVRYIEEEDSPMLETDIRYDTDGKSWKQIRKKYIFRWSDSKDDDWKFSDDESESDQSESDESESDEYESNDAVEEDAYQDVDEYTWTPLHFNPNP
ncbi:hypothetical protein QBC38DRAFT_493242 [Podospora fimiseda]|uniref:Uncharacterized protein n=1 Tax=Podospora fimiseda TaxID=252190 RepID=A0AAN6YR57_9PEZI|nr:hypothetical protein QBC38DRAFT_493242 [Podospora fimiseda]